MTTRKRVKLMVFKVRRSAKRVVRRFARDGKGATAIEFAMIAVPFFGLLFALFETALVFFLSSSLDVAVGEAARQFFTGTAQAANVSTAATFKSNLLCPTTGRILPTTFDCSKVIIDMQTAASFGSANTSKDFYTSGSTKFCPGGPSEIMVVRVVYPMPVYLTILSGWGSNVSANRSGQTMDSGKWTHTLLSTVVFRNEPFSSYTKPAGC